MEIKWLDGESADDKYILEIVFSNGSKGYIKNYSLDQINRYKNLMINDKDVLDCLIHEPFSFSKCA